MAMVGRRLRGGDEGGGGKGSVEGVDDGKGALDGAQRISGSAFGEMDLEDALRYDQYWDDVKTGKYDIPYGMTDEEYYQFLKGLDKVDRGIKGGSKSGNNTNKLFKNQSLLDEHYSKHGQEIADVLGDSNYSIDKYLDDANYIINNGTYAPELNGYVSFMSGKKYGFVGLDRTTGDITTFHIKNISELIKKAPSLGFER